MYKVFRGLLLSLFVAAVLVSCKKDDEKVNVSEVAGEYVALIATYELHADGSITTTSEAGEIEDLIDIDIVDVSVSGNKVTAKDSDGELFFESTNLVEASNGVVWNLAVPADVFPALAEYGYTIAGFEKYEMDGKKYQAFYDANDKSIDFSLVLVSSVEENPDIVIEVLCSK